MAVNGEVSRVRGFNEKYEPIFRLSRFFGAFPFKLTEDGIESTKPLLLLSALPVFLPYVSFLFLENHIQLFKDVVSPKFYFLSYLFPLFCLATVPPLSIFWLNRKVGKLQKTFEALRKVEVETSREAKKVSNTHPLLMLLIFIPVYTAERYLFGKSYSTDPCTYTNFYAVFLNVLVVSQFTSMLRIIRNEYEYLTDTLDIGKAQTWLSCHEHLGGCCRLLSESYSPQLLLVIISSFVYVVFQTYFIEQSHKNENLDYGIYVFLFWISFFTLLTWYIAYSCRFTKLEAKKFDKLLYHLIINDNTKTLLKNKRILLHFKAKRKEEFSAMGFFNFDYPLLCSMVSSATTYIVILVQFS